MILYEELASVSQRMLWLIQRYRGGRGRLNYPLLLRLRGPLDVAALRHALDLLVARHEALRTTFARRRGLLTQLVHAPAAVPVDVVCVDDTDGLGLDDHVRAEVERDIDAAVSSLRVTLWRVAATDHLLCVNAHHCVTDAWSARIIADELLHLLSTGQPELPRVQWQYRHVVAWQRRRSTVEAWRADGDYWRERLRPPVPRVLAAASAGSGVSEDHRIRREVPPAVAQRVRHVARTAGGTPFAVLLAAYYRALYDLGGCQDLAVVAPFANRGRPETAATVGPFANLVILRTQLDPTADFPDLVRRANRTVTEASAHQAFPYYLLPGHSDATRADRFDDLVIQLLPELPRPARLGDLEVTVVAPELAGRFDLELNIVPRPDGLTVHLQCAAGRVDPDLAADLADRYHAIVSGL